MRKLFRDDPRGARRCCGSSRRASSTRRSSRERFGAAARGRPDTRRPGRAAVRRHQAGRGDARGGAQRARGAGIRTGLISNSMGAGRYDRDAFPELFDAVVISGDVGLHKPQPEIFQLGAERVGLAPEECVFVDDLRENCAGAEAVGMTAVLHRGAETTLPGARAAAGSGSREARLALIAVLAVALLVPAGARPRPSCRRATRSSGAASAATRRRTSATSRASRASTRRSTGTS